MAEITATFPTLTFGKRGVQTRGDFVQTQENGQDTLSGTWAEAAELFKTETNAVKTEVNTSRDTAVLSATSATTQAGIATDKALEAAQSLASLPVGQINDSVILTTNTFSNSYVDGFIHREPTIASFRIMTSTPSTVYVKAYDNSGNTDGAFGSHFFKRVTDTDQVDNSGTIIRTVNGVYELQYSGTVNVKWFGAVGDWNGVTGTNNTSMIQSAIDNCKDICIPDGKFAAVGLKSILNGSISGTGKNSIIALYSTGTLITIDTPSFNIKDVSMYGNNQGDGGFESFTTPRGIDIGIYVNGTTVEDISFSNIKAYGFNSSAISCENVVSGSTISKSINFTNVYTYRNYVGIELLENAEYCLLTNCNSYRNSYALWQVGGNNKFVNCNFTNSRHNCYITTGTNDNHAGFFGCSFNHNTGGSLGTGLYVNGDSYGVEFIGCKFWYGNIKLINANGIRISNGQLGGIEVTVTNGYINWIHDNYTFGTITKTFSGNYRTVWKNNNDTNVDATTDETKFYNQYYVKSSITTNTFNGGVDVLTNLSSQSGYRHTIADSSLYNTNFLVFPESNIYSFNIIATVKATASSVNQSAKIILKIVTGGLALVKKYEFNVYIQAGSTEQTHTFNIDTFVQSGLYAGIYVSAGDTTNGFILSGLTLECMDK